MYTKPFEFYKTFNVKPYTAGSWFENNGAVAFGLVQKRLGGFLNTLKLNYNNSIKRYVYYYDNRNNNHHC